MEGIAGIAYDSRIIPVRIAFSNGFPRGDPRRAWISNDTQIANGILWAEQNDADILSNSWGGGSYSATIANAINTVINNGAVVLFAAGNDNSGVSFPATLNDVIAVGATSQCDERKSPASCDGENWGSNFGSQLDIVAPGVEIFTTDISGGAGYVVGDYETDFNGTSSACPNAAGVAALILSINPDLSPLEVKTLMEETAEKVGGYNYSFISGKPNGTWNNEMGYGRINAEEAVKKAYRSEILGTDLFCTYNQETFELINIPSGATNLTWNYPGFLSYISGQGTDELVLGAYGANRPGDYYISVEASVNGETIVLAKKSLLVRNTTSQTPSSPYITLHQDNPDDLYCCGQVQTFYQGKCAYNCNDLEWSFDVEYQNAQDNYNFNIDTGLITAVKNTYSPLILNIKARNRAEGCGNPSNWSNEINRYYGTIGSNSSFKTTSSQYSLSNSDENLPLEIIYLVAANEIQVNKISLLEWLNYKFSNRNLTKEEVSVIKNLLYHYDDNSKFSFSIYNMNGKEILSNQILEDSKIKLRDYIPSRKTLKIVKLRMGEFETNIKVIY